MWKPFHFESNRFFGSIQGLDDWKRLKSAFPEKTDDELLASKEATYKGTRLASEREKRPNYGLRIEHDGEKTLRDFFSENEMLDLLQDAKL